MTSVSRVGQQNGHYTVDYERWGCLGCQKYRHSRGVGILREAPGLREGRERVMDQKRDMAWTVKKAPVPSSDDYAVGPLITDPPCMHRDSNTNIFYSTVLGHVKYFYAGHIHRDCHCDLN